MLYLGVSMIGIMISFMIALNGALSIHLSLMEISLIVHLLGLVILSLILLFRKEKLVLKGMPKIFLLTGLLGTLLTAIDAYAVSVLGVTLAVTLSTVAQLAGSAGVDARGLGQLQKVPFNKKRIRSLSLLLLGVAILLYAQWKGL